MTELGITVARHEERIKSNETCLEKVKERMEKIEAKIDRIYLTAVGSLVTAVTLLALRLFEIGMRR